MKSSLQSLDRNRPTPQLAGATRRPGTGGRARTARSQPPTRRASPRGRDRVLFHAPSFSAGVVLGALIILAATYLPELTGGSGSASPGSAAAPAPSEPGLTFEFDQLLQGSHVEVDPEPYVSEADKGPPKHLEYLLQAASFRAFDDAETLRAQLLLQDLPATTSSTKLANGTWYRVMVGPYQRRQEAQRALTRLREQKLDAFPITRELDP
ncbi:MAG: SPOR domain-containing protein [Pseudomonadales bacterium]